MANRIEGVQEKVIECAKAEFLEKGYKDASLRVIAQNAGTSTGSIYTRFQDKEGLFYEIVSPVVEDVKRWFIKKQEDFHQNDEVTQTEEVYDYSKDAIEQFVEYIYENFDEFKLLLNGSYGTEFSNFINDLVEIEVDYTIKFLEVTHNDAVSSGRISKEFLHIINSAYYSGIFEIVLHDMKKEDGLHYVRQLRDFYYAGSETIYGLKN